MTPFEKKVYKAVMTIPIGQVRTYKWIARKTGRPDAARAVGRILNKNPYPILIPCHRVIGSDNKLVGYSLGLGRKKKLLALEKDILRQLGSSRGLGKISMHKP